MDTDRYSKDKAAVMAMIKFILMFLIFAAICFFATKIVTILIPFLIGFLLAKTSLAISKPITSIYKGRKPKGVIHRKAAIVIYFILIVFIAILLVWGCTSLIGQLSRAISTFSRLINEFNPVEFGNNIIAKFAKSNGGFLTDKMIDSLKDNITSIWNDSVQALPSILSSLITSLLNMVSNIPYGIFVVVCVLLSGYYFINDGHSVLRFYMRNIPNKSFRTKSLSLINDLSVTLFRALGGYILLLFITAFEAWVIFRLAGIEYAVILALITGIIDFMPVLGVSATMIPVMIYCVLHGNYKGLVILIIGMAIITVVRRLIEPPILGKSLHLHPLMMLIAMAMGVYVWGAIGFLLGPTVFIIVYDIIKVFGLDKKLLSFLSRVLGNFMKPAEETKTTGKKRLKKQQAVEEK